MTAPRADLDELGRLLAEAREEGYWAGYGEGKDEAETRDLNYDTLTDQNAALLAEVSELRETVARVKALADRWDITGDEDMRFRFVEQLRAALDGAQ